MPSAPTALVISSLYLTDLNLFPSSFLSFLFVSYYTMLSRSSTLVELEYRRPSKLDTMDQPPNDTTMDRSPSYVPGGTAVEFGVERKDFSMHRRNSIQTDAMASLSVAIDPGNSYSDEPTWPKGWRPWTALLGCFFLMFNSWGWVNVCDASPIASAN